MLHNVVRSWPRLLGLVVLAGLLGAAVVTVSLARAAPPGDLALTLSLVEDSDNIVPPGSTLRVAATLTYSSDYHVFLDVPPSALRIAGDLEWDSLGRRAHPLTRQGHLGARTEWSDVAVQADPVGDIAVFGMIWGPNTCCVGSADVYVGGVFAAHLRGAGPRSHIFGYSVDVGGGVIVIGAPDGENGAAYVFERNAAGVWTEVAELTPGSNPAYTDPATQDKPLWFGFGVAISDDGSTIVISKVPSPGLGVAHNWGATGHVFTRPAGGWRDMDTNHPSVTALRYHDAGDSNTNPDDMFSIASRNDAYGDADIAGNGSVVALGGYALPRTADATDQQGAVLIFRRPAGGWADAGGADGMLEQDAVLTATDDDSNDIQLGQAIAINVDGSVVLAGALGGLGRADGGTVGTSLGSLSWPGSAFVWVRPATGWTDTNDATATLSDSTANNEDQFAEHVAISDSGDRIIVSDSISDAAHVFDKPALGWQDDSAADLLLTSPKPISLDPAIGALGVAFGGRTALDGESTAIVGQTEWQLPPAGPGSHAGGFAFNLAAAEPQADAVYLRPCTSRSVDGLTTWTCPVYIGDTSITIPLGTPDGTFTISGVLTVDGVEYSDTLEVTIDEVDEVTEVQFDFAEYESGVKLGERYPDAIAAGETTRLRLGVLNEHGKASAGGSIASVLFTTTAGSLSTSIGGGCVGGGGLVCQIPVSALTAANADKIDLTVAHPGQGRSGAAEIRAAVVAVDGETFNADPLRVTLTGEAALLAISEPATSVLNVHTADFGAERDDRDMLTLTVRATDEEGRKAAVPTHSRRVVITGPDGRRVEAGTPYDPASPPALIVAWPKVGGSFAPHLGAPRTAAELLGSYDVVNKWSLGVGWQWYSVDANGDPARGATNFVASDGDVLRFDNLILDADGNLQVELDVDAGRANPLTPGEYTLELRAGGLTARRSFSVVGEAAALTLSEATGSTEDGGRLSLTATLADGDGNTVADGTPVRWEEGGTAAQVVLVQLSAEAKTTDGRASATYLVVGQGSAWVRASSGEATNTRGMFNLGAAPAPANPAELLSSRTPGALAAWLGVGATSASALLAGLDGIDSIAVWRDGVWLRYEVVDGAAAGGAVDFEVRRGEIVRLGG